MSAPNSDSTEGAVAPVTAGPVGPLREARERLGLTLADVARHLKLHPRQVEALEQDDFGVLPGPVFVRGFMRNYARLVGLDGESLVAQAERSGRLPAASRTQVTGSGQGAGLEPMQPSLRTPLEKTHGRKGWIPIVVVLITVAAGIIYFHGRDTAVTPPAEEVPKPPPQAEAPVPAPGPESVAMPPAPQAVETAVAPVQPEVPALSATPADAPAARPPTVPEPAAKPLAEAVPPESPKPAAAPAKPAAPKPAAVPAPPAAAADARPEARAPTRETGAPSAPLDVSAQRPATGPEIRLSFSKESWVEIRDSSGSVIFSQLNPAGTERVVRGQPPFEVTVGNAAGVSVKYNAREIDLSPHTRTDVAHITLE